MGRRWSLLAAVLAASVLPGCILDYYYSEPTGRPRNDPAYCNFGEPVRSGLDIALTSAGHAPWVLRAPGLGPPPIRVNLTLPETSGGSHLLVVFLAEDDGARGGSASSVTLAGVALERATHTEVGGSFRPDQAISAWWIEFDNRGFPFDDHPDGTAELVVRWRADLDAWGLFAISYREVPLIDPVGHATNLTGTTRDIRLSLRPENNGFFAKGGLGLAAFAHDDHQGAFEPTAGTVEVLDIAAGTAIRLVVAEFAHGDDARLIRTFGYTASNVSERASARDWAAIGLGIEGIAHNLTADQREVCSRSDNRSSSSTG